MKKNAFVLLGYAVLAVAALAWLFITAVAVNETFDIISLGSAVWAGFAVPETNGRTWLRELKEKGCQRISEVGGVVEVSFFDGSTVKLWNGAGEAQVLDLEVIRYADSVFMFVTSYVRGVEVLEGCAFHELLMFLAYVSENRHYFVKSEVGAI